MSVIAGSRTRLWIGYKSEIWHTTPEGTIQKAQGVVVREATLEEYMAFGVKILGFENFAVQPGDEHFYEMLVD